MVPTIYISADTPYALGLKHGRRLKSELHSMIRELRELIAKEFPLFRIIPLGLFMHLMSPLLKLKFPERHLMELKGIAEGSGVRLLRGRRGREVA